MCIFQIRMEDQDENFRGNQPFEKVQETDEFNDRLTEAVSGQFYERHRFIGCMGRVYSTSSSTTSAPKKYHLTAPFDLGSLSEEYRHEYIRDQNLTCSFKIHEKCFSMMKKYWRLLGVLDYYTEDGLIYIIGRTLEDDAFRAYGNSGLWMNREDYTFMKPHPESGRFLHETALEFELTDEELANPYLAHMVYSEVLYLAADPDKFHKHEGRVAEALAASGCSGRECNSPEEQEDDGSNRQRDAFQAQLYA
ncbi:hypothetical protein UCRPC4_g03914 [Phaeomoniella chlamydospora]|uniref:Uncharacterized protein n=1 Tax=Phaeomoniella chlamydospora TaxID=158046 RepID=A0A0G2EDL5_PHACM|nr:hypothetical protein UCRPC4_g03914 [Phaeomoniella chlamydospora]